MQKVDIWFGDSWTIGSELANDFSPLEHAELKHYFKQNKHSFPNVDLAQNPLQSYPAFVSQHRDAGYINYASAGGSYQFAYFQMCRWWSSKQYNNNIEYTFWLQTMPATRSFGINNDFEWHHFLGIDNTFEQTKTNPEFSIYEAQTMINSMYTFCKMLNIEFKIVPLWIGHNVLSEINIVPDHVWISPPHKNMLSDIFGNNIFADGGIDTKDLTIEQIQSIIKQYDFIQPNLCHPNKQAHMDIAEYIIKNI
jgi:hypothetical protein